MVEGQEGLGSRFNSGLYSEADSQSKEGPGDNSKETLTSHNIALLLFKYICDPAVNAGLTATSID